MVMTPRSRTLLRRAGLVFMGLLTLTVIALSFVQLWMVSTTDNLSAYGAAQTDQRGWPQADKRGAFLMLSDNRNPSFPSNLVELLATTEPGVVTTDEGVHLQSYELKSVLVQSAIVSEPEQYRVYRIGETDQDKMNAVRQPGGKVMIISPERGNWSPGAYLVDIPAEGMFGGRTYYQFYIDASE